MVHNSICSRPGGKLVRIDEAEYEQRPLLAAGRTMETLGYWSLEHGVSKNELIAAIVTHMERSSRTIWDNLRRLHPKLQMMQERVKKMRTHAEAQEGPDPGFESAVYPPWVPKSLRTRTGCRRLSGPRSAT
jgi:hypothetical protein